MRPLDARNMYTVAVIVAVRSGPDPDNPDTENVVRRSLVSITPQRGSNAIPVVDVGAGHEYPLSARPVQSVFGRSGLAFDHCGT